MAFLKSGIHATVAGVLLAMTIPARSSINPKEFLQKGQRVLDSFAGASESGESVLTSPQHQDALHTLEKASKAVQAPMLRAEQFAAIMSSTKYLQQPLGF